MRALLADAAHQLGGDVAGQQILCPGPGHSPRDRSLSVRLSSTAPDGFVVFSHAGDDIGTCKDHVRQRLGWEQDRGWCRNTFLRPHRDLGVVETTPTVPDQSETAKIARATAIWNEARHPSGTLVDTYLASRELEIPHEAAGEALRFHPACPWQDQASGQTLRVPAMVAAMRSINDPDIITGIHRTRLTSDGQKVDRRMLGKASGAAIMLSPYTMVGPGLCLGEGIETTLAGMKIGWRPAWALGSVGAIERFAVMPFMQSLILLAETGDGGASARAVDAAARRYAEAGREVIVVEPRCDGDANDAIRGAA